MVGLWYSANASISHSVLLPSIQMSDNTDYYRVFSFLNQTDYISHLLKFQQMSVVERNNNIEVKYKICTINGSGQNCQLGIHLGPCLCISQFRLCWFISPFAISLILYFYELVLQKNVQANHMLLTWHWHARGMHGSPHHFAIGSETACPFFVTDRLCLLQMTICNHFLLFFSYSHYERRDNQTQKAFQWLELIVDASVVTQLKLLMYYSAWKQFNGSNF